MDSPESPFPGAAQDTARDADSDVPSPIRIEFAPPLGVRQVALTPAEILERSGAAIEDAMAIIQDMTGRVRSAITTMAERPSEIDVAFGIKFDAEAGALVAKAGVEASINVVLRWKDSEPAEQRAPSDPTPRSGT